MLSKYKGFEAYVAVPKGTKPKRGLLVIQEYWGLNEQMKQLTNRFSTGSYDDALPNQEPKKAGGFIAVCPDLYHNVSANYGEVDKAKHLMSGLDFGKAVQECKTWIEFLMVEQGCTSVGVTGFCLGGALSLLVASMLADQKFTVSAAAPFYGIPPQFDAKKIKCPLLLTFGAEDQSKGFSSVEDMQKLVEQLKQRSSTEGVVVENVVQGVGHAFMNEARPDVYNKNEAVKAFNQTVEFFDKHLK